MPPTTGHLQLLQFANKLAPDGVVAIINTQPHEPFPKERAGALRAAIKRVGLARRVKLIHYKKAIEQDPKTDHFALKSARAPCKKRLGLLMVARTASTRRFQDFRTLYL